MKHRHLIKWGIIIGLSLLFTALSSLCGSKAEGVEAEPTPSASDPSYDFFDYPDWATTTQFAYTTPNPSPTATPDPSMRDPVETLPDGTPLTYFGSDYSYQSFLICWQAFLYNGDSSVWYFKSHTNQQIAVAANRNYRPFFPWLDSGGQTTFLDAGNYLNPKNTSGNIVLLSSSNSLTDLSEGYYNFSFFDRNLVTTSTQIPANKRLVYYFALNKLYPKLYNPPSWFAEVGITEDSLYDLEFVPFCEIVCSDGSKYNYYPDLPSYTLRDLYSGVTFDMDLRDFFGNSGARVTSIAINFAISPSDNWSPMAAYRQYLADNPQITGHIPFYIYWDGSNCAAQTGSGAFVFRRYYATNPVEDQRNFLQKLFIPSMDELYEMFNYYLPNIDQNGAFSFALSFREFLFNVFLGDSPPDATITFPSLDIPIGARGQTAHIADSYTFNFTQLLTKVGLKNPIKYVFNILLTIVFLNSVISLVFSIFDIKYFDGVN